MEEVKLSLRIEILASEFSAMIDGILSRLGVAMNCPISLNPVDTTLFLPSEIKKNLTIPTNDSK